MRDCSRKTGLRRIRALLACAALSVATAGLLLAGCRVEGKEKRAAAAHNDFVGNAVCAECHTREAGEHAGTNHDQSLRLAKASALGKLAPPVGPIKDGRFEIRREGDDFSFARRDRPDQPVKMEYAFGSGKTGMTYVTVKGADTTLEFRMSCFPHTGEWYLTPGQEGIGNDDLHLPRQGETARKCFECHASALEPGSVRPRANAFGVGCESCHGPGLLHVQAAQVKGATDLKMEKIESWGAEKINRLCGKCHRTIDDIDLASTQVTMTQRFQPYGLMQSPCFKKSGDKLSCLTCHDPHTDATKSQKFYESACLRCHAGPQSSAPSNRIMVSNICPVNPNEKCVSCHMPPRKVFPFSKAPVYMADHLIWAYGRKKSKQ